MKNLILSKKTREISGEITLDGSKSLSNRALILQALCDESFDLKNLSTSHDTKTLQKLLNKGGKVFDAGHAGTTFRFMTAYLAFQKGVQILTGSERMKQRPIGLLVDALREIGAKIEYLENEGYPPLKIYSPKKSKNNSVKIKGNISSQYLSALIMLAPTLPRGLEIIIEGDLVSRPYLEMTLKMLAHFGVGSNFQDNIIWIPPQKIQANELTIESDWSAASYYYSLMAIAEKGKLILNGLFENSWQGDSAAVELSKQFGIETTFCKNSLVLKKTTSSTNLSASKRPDSVSEQDDLKIDFTECPDIAQTFAVMCGALGKKGIFSGLSTLKIKETDRVAALTNELAKVGVSFTEIGEDSCKVSGEAILPGKDARATFETYKDHRMAMAFAPLALLGEIEFVDPEVVKKSYPNFWKDLRALGFEIR